MFPGDPQENVDDNVVVTLEVDHGLELESFPSREHRWHQFGYLPVIYLEDVL